MSGGLRSRWKAYRVSKCICRGKSCIGGFCLGVSVEGFLSREFEVYGGVLWLYTGDVSQRWQVKCGWVETVE